MEQIDLEASFQDSPEYRLLIERRGEYVGEVEVKAKAMAKAARASLDACNEFIAKNVALAESLIDYGTLEHRMFALDQTASGPKSPEDCQQLFLGGLISQVGDQLRRIEEDRYQYTLQLETLFIEPLEVFCKSDLNQIKDLKKRLEKTQADFCHENSKYMSKKSKDLGLFESALEVADLRKVYHEASLDLALKLNEIVWRKDVCLTDALIGLAQIRNSLVMRQATHLSELMKTIAELDSWAARRRQDLSFTASEALEKKRRILSKSADCYNPLIVDKSMSSKELTEKSGYLYKKSSHSVRPIWARRFFRLHEETLEYFSLEDKGTPAPIPIDLRLCLVRPIDPGERRFTFEIMSPAKYSHTLSDTHIFEP